jgi:anaerobic ribonucleoside-triphosphate reductase activating protein
VSRAIEVGAFVPRTAVEGPFVRAAVWLQGCSIRCPGCCNPELFARGRGRSLPAEALAQAVLDGGDAIEGLSVLGGEPLDQIAALAELCRHVAMGGRGVIVFTGYTFDEARALDGFDTLQPWVDTWVTGRFVASELERQRRFIGSRNQVLVHRTMRYADPALWEGPVCAEVIIAPPTRDTPGTAIARVVGAPTIARLLVQVARRREADEQAPR